jgi:hypothetical protein
MTVSPVSVQICAICSRRSWLPGFGDAAMTYAIAGMRVLARARSASAVADLGGQLDRADYVHEQHGAQEPVRTSQWRPGSRSRRVSRIRLLAPMS